MQEANRTEAAAQVAEQIKASFMLSGANNGMHQELKNHLENKYAVKQEDGYPDNTVELLQLMNNFRAPSNNIRSVPRRMIPQDEDGINFAQEGEEGAENDGVNMLQQGEGPAARHTYQYQKQELSHEGQRNSKKVTFNKPDPVKVQAKKDKQESPGVATATCLHCGGNNHLAECPDLIQDQLGQILVQLNEASAARTNPDEGSPIQQTTTWADKVKEGGSLVQKNKTSESEIKTGGLKKSYLYLDTCTTNDQVMDSTYLTNVHEADQALTLHTNVGTSNTHMQGYLGSYLF